MRNAGQSLLREPKVGERWRWRKTGEIGVIHAVSGGEVTVLGDEGGPWWTIKAPLYGFIVDFEPLEPLP